MRPFWKDVLTAMVMGLILPGVLLNTADYFLLAEEKLPEQAVLQTPVETIPEIGTLTVELLTHTGMKGMPLENYLIGVVLAEMPVEFELEALKAQAVAARTYTLKAQETGGKHSNGSLCTNAACCQAYIEQDDYLEQGGTAEGLQKVTRAVTETAGNVLLYGDKLIEATYFSCSGGSTEDASAVWGAEFPYLQAVPSPGEEKALYYTDSVSFTPRQFQNALGVILPGEPVSWFRSVTFTEGGGVASMTIGGETYTGTQLRSLLNLRSTAFAITAGERITITTRGNGHRVGMSQYGADAMAVMGSSYAEILAHYYPGTMLTQLG